MTALTDQDEDLLQDFLTESGELLEKLGEQLVELEADPASPELLNAVFRAFHTVKGGAGFLELPAVVELCHLAEDLFGQVREGRRQVDAALLDPMHEVVTSLETMLAQAAAGNAPDAAAPGLLAALRNHQAADAPTQLAEAPAAAAEPAAVDPAEAALDSLLADADADAGTGSDEISDDEFESLLDELHGRAAPSAVASKPAAAPAPDDGISEDEFEALLDELHGPVAAPGKAAAAPPVAEPAAARKTEAEAPNPKPAPPASVRVDTAKLDAIMNQVGELVLIRNRFKAMRAGASGDAFERVVAELDGITSRLQSGVMQTRMQPISKVFSRFPKVARDVARSLNKQVRLELRGAETDLDKNLVEALADPLVHLVRNAIDHGIELPDVRRRRGKPEEGQVVLSAQQEGDHILIRIEDDGAGMDAELLRKKAREKGLVGADEAAAMDEEQCYSLIFLPGFSTKAEVSEISGRGVGMDVVRSQISKLNGSVKISSKLGHGSSLQIRVPLTLAILPTLMVIVAGRTYALPLAPVMEILPYRPADVQWLDGREILDDARATTPIIQLGQWFGAQDRAPAADARLVIVQLGDDYFAFCVDQVIGREEVVVKPLGAMLQGLSGFAGATITGQGGIALIPDLPGLLKSRGLLR